MNTIRIDGYIFPKHEFDAVIVGSGVAGLNAADSLFSLGVKNIAIVTEGMMMGTSRNTGSDKQTYYKVSSSGSDRDSVYDMAKTLYDCGSMNGDNALVEAAYSSRSFYKLVNLGLPFPSNEFGEFVGYRTDHDSRKRATSCGPLTSKLMTEALQKEIENKNIPVFDGERVIKLISDKKRVYGFISVNPSNITEKNPCGISVFTAANTVYAVGGPSAVYEDTVYPESQTCALGTAFEAGAEGANLTESQYGIASTGFRWNLSGTYQQVIPTYISVGPDGKPEEFLGRYFADTESAVNATFFKGYQWPFDPAKVLEGTKSSMIDIAVFSELKKGRKVYLDYRKNPDGFSTSLLCKEAYDYLSNSGAIEGLPIDRLRKMNPKAVELYKNHGISLEKDLLEISVCAQHNNGGLAVDSYYESTTLKHFFPVGECAGVFGIHRPGGTALNSAMVSSLRASQKISEYSESAEYTRLRKAVREENETLIARLGGTMKLSDIIAKRKEYGKTMSSCGAFLRPYGEVIKAIQYFENELVNEKNYGVQNPELITALSINHDIIVTAITYLSAIRDYIDDGGLSRGSYLISDTVLPKSVELDSVHRTKVQYTKYGPGSTVSRFRKCRKIPKSEQWFETVYSKK